MKHEGRVSVHQLEMGQNGVGVCSDISLVPFSSTDPSLNLGLQHEAEEDYRLTAWPAAPIWVTSVVPQAEDTLTAPFVLTGERQRTARSEIRVSNPFYCSRHSLVAAIRQQRALLHAATFQNAIY